MNALSVIFVAFVTAFVTALGTVYAIERLHLFSPPAAQQVAVPNLVGLTEADAKSNLAASGFKLLVAGREATDKAEAGTVIRQLPPAGNLVAAGSAIGATFALAPPKVADVVGRPVADATRMLQEAGYSVQVVAAVPSPEHAKGLIAVQSPKGGTPLAKNGVVTLQPSDGPAAVQVPKLVGLSVPKATAEAEKLNLKLVVQWVELAETATNVVLRQTPAAGETAAPQSEVKVTVNR